MKCSNFRNKLTMFQYSYTDFYIVPRNVESKNCLLYVCFSLKEYKILKFESQKRCSDVCINEQLNYYFPLTSKLWHICWNDQYVSKHSAVLVLCKTPLLGVISFYICHCNIEEECFKLTVLWVKNNYPDRSCLYHSAVLSQRAIPN
jgi:hypothetical protein